MPVQVQQAAASGTSSKSVEQAEIVRYMMITPKKVGQALLLVTV
jgi:hypothetical protein